MKSSKGNERPMEAMSQQTAVGHLQKSKPTTGGVMVEEKSSELLPCPFCGGPAEKIDPGFAKSRVRCENPGNLPWCIGTEVSATPEQWNTRTPYGQGEQPEQNSESQSVDVQQGEQSENQLATASEFRAMLKEADDEITRLKQAMGWILDAADAAYIEDENNERIHEIFNIAAKASGITRRLPDENHPFEL